jgi:hemerythrin-like domain-containing protein
MIPTLDVGAPATSAPSVRFAAIDQLLAEHREIEALTDALVRWGEGLGARPTDQRREATRFVHVLRSFVADWHHAREDAILFQMLDEACPSRDRGAVAVMLQEHQRLDDLVTELAVLAAANTSWAAADRARVVAITRSYTDLQRLHVAKEEKLVFPMAEALVGGAARIEMDIRFAAFACSEGDESLAVLRGLSSSLKTAHPAA